MQHLVRIIRRRRLIFLLYLGLVLALAPGLGRLGQNNAPEAFFVQEHRALETFRDFEFHFGRSRMLRGRDSGRSVLILHIF